MKEGFPTDALIRRFLLGDVDEEEHERHRHHHDPQPPQRLAVALHRSHAEAVADLIHAETEAQKQLALNQMGGALSALYQGWAERLVRALAYAEAQIDFSEEDLPEEEVASHIRPELLSVGEEMKAHLDDGHRGERLRDGIRIAVIGSPNAGKSSLVNALAKRDVAIVFDMAGTTRDVLEVHLDLNGYPVTLYDTAGLRPEQLGGDAQDRIEAEGIRRALEKAREADFKILLFDGTEPVLHPRTLALNDDNALIVINKIDIADDTKTHLGRDAYPADAIRISTKTGEGLSGLLANVSRETSRLFEAGLDRPSLTRARHREALEEAQAALHRALAGMATPDMVAEDIRLAVRALGRITGRVDVEDLLDIIFRDFCIGK